MSKNRRKEHEMPILIRVFPWLTLIQLLAVAVTCYDKISAIYLPRHRVRERTLMLIAALGGALGMYLCMLVIRHKTKKPLFMLGLPLLLLFHLALVLLLLIAI